MESCADYSPSDGHYLNLPVVETDGRLIAIVDVLKLTYATLEQMNAMKNLKAAYMTWPSITIDITFPKSEGPAGYVPALGRVFDEAIKAIENKDKIIILSYKNTSSDRVPISAIIAQ